MKKCPYCAEEIQDEAKKCKHCGEFLVEKAEEKPAPAPPVVAPAPPAANNGHATAEQSVMGCFAVLLILGLCWFAVTPSVQSTPTYPPPGAAAPAPATVKVTKAEMGKDWPFTCAAGQLKSEPVKVGDRDMKAIWFQPDGSSTWYAINGLALQKGAPDIETSGVWALDPNAPEGTGIRLSIGPLHDRAP